MPASTDPPSSERDSAGQLSRQLSERSTEQPADKPLIAVVAMTPDGVIGRDGDMPWRLRSDLQRFKRLTMGGVLIMGRKTYDSIGRPLPGRRTVVLTRNPDWTAAGVQTASSVEAAIASLGDDQGFVVGGAEIYRLLLPFCHQIFLTRVLCDVQGETVLDFDPSGFRIDEISRLPASATDQYPTEFMKMSRIGSPSSATIAASTET